MNTPSEPQHGAAVKKEEPLDGDQRGAAGPALSVSVAATSADVVSRTGGAPAEPPAAFRDVVYMRDDSLSLCDFGLFVAQHAMKPWRLHATHMLVEAMGLHRYLRVLQPPRVTLDDVAAFHSPEYLQRLCIHNSESWHWGPTVSHVAFSGDCPPVDGIVEFSCGAAAGSLMGAALLNARRCDVAINWAGGMHHAKCGECAGFCYVNDIVIGILELLKCHRRVLYIDLDVHHGDGVEEAFYTTSRVFTMSLHKFGEGFFPGTGSPRDVGMGDGRYTAMNLGLFDGIGDFHYVDIFSYALRAVMEAYRPDAIVLQCGADSLSGDRVGVFNLSSEGHGRCVSLVAQLGLPLLAVGGGGYTVKHTAELWAYETAILCGVPVNPVASVQQRSSTAWVHAPRDTLLVASEFAPSVNPAATPNAHLAQLRRFVDEFASNIPPPPLESESE